MSTTSLENEKRTYDKGGKWPCTTATLPRVFCFAEDVGVARTSTRPIVTLIDGSGSGGASSKRCSRRVLVCLMKRSENCRVEVVVASWTTVLTDGAVDGSGSVRWTDFCSSRSAGF